MLGIPSRSYVDICHCFLCSSSARQTVLRGRGKRIEIVKWDTGKLSSWQINAKRLFSSTYHSMFASAFLKLFRTIFFLPFRNTKDQRLVYLCLQFLAAAISRRTFPFFPQRIFIYDVTFCMQDKGLRKCFVK